MDIKKIHIENYKCFKSITLENLRPINVIIGKNNIGKSSILDIFEMVYNVQKLSSSKVNIRLEKKITEAEISKVFSKGTSGGGIPGDHYEFGKKLIDLDFPFEIYSNNDRIEQRSISDISSFNEKYNSKQKDKWDLLARNMAYRKKTTKRVLAERNIFPEEESELMSTDGNGNGITTIINNFINKSEYNESYIRENLLSKLNEIMGNDASFTELVTQQIKKNESTKWEIFLREDSKGRIALSDSGSGLKTILIVLVHTILLPVIERKAIKDYIFMFEELENNLHPSLQRRLLKYLETLTKDGAMFFLTTHSNIVLDAYQNNDIVNVIHVIKDNRNHISLQNMANHFHASEILNDLGVRASDLLQANGIIWVEGPSDRVYLNKWIELWSNDELREGKDYQCVFYGGRLLSNLTLNEESDFVNLLKVNRNSAIIIDSDKDAFESTINETKERICAETLKGGLFSWVTAGREIENYLSAEFVKKYFQLSSKRTEFKQFDKFEAFLEKLIEYKGKYFKKHKTLFAREIIKESTKSDFDQVLDLNEKMDSLVNLIRSWNRS